MNPNPLEKEIEAKIGQYAKSKGCLWKKWSSPGQRGVPDRIIVTPTGVVGFLELKQKGKKPSPLQMVELQKLKAQHCNVGWVDNVESGIAVVNLLCLRLHATIPLVYGVGL